MQSFLRIWVITIKTIVIFYQWKNNGSKLGFILFAWLQMDNTHLIMILHVINYLSGRKKYVSIKHLAEFMVRIMHVAI